MWVWTLISFKIDKLRSFTRNLLNHAANKLAFIWKSFEAFVIYLLVYKSIWSFHQLSQFMISQVSIFVKILVHTYRSQVAASFLYKCVKMTVFINAIELLIGCNSNRLHGPFQLAPLCILAFWFHDFLGLLWFHDWELTELMLVKFCGNVNIEWFNLHALSLQRHHHRHRQRV